MKNLTWQNPEQLFVAQVLINKVKSKCCGIKVNENYWSNVNNILTWLKSKYILNKQESSSTQMVFYDKLNRMKIVFDASGFVSYTDSEQSPFTPASSSYNAIGVKAKKFQVKFGY